MINIGVIGNRGKSAIIEIILNELIKDNKKVVVVGANNSNNCSKNSDCSSKSYNLNDNDRDNDCTDKRYDNNNESEHNRKASSGNNTNSDTKNINNSNISQEYTITSISKEAMLHHKTGSIKFDILIQTAIEEESDEIITALQNAVMSIRENGYFIFNSDFIQKINFPCESVYPVTYGLNGRTTITTSSIDNTDNLSFNFCLQRSIISLSESILQPFEIPVKVDGKYNDINYYLAALTCLLILGYKF